MPDTEGEDSGARGIVEIFHDGRVVGGGVGSVSAEICLSPEIGRQRSPGVTRIDRRVIRVFICHSLGATGAEIELAQARRAMSTLGSGGSGGALSAIATCTISSVEGNVEGGTSMTLEPCPGEISATLGESMSRDVIRVQISRSRIPIIRIEVDRRGVDLLIRQLDELCHGA
jgi:hypothetical protein